MLYFRFRRSLLLWKLFPYLFIIVIVWVIDYDVSTWAWKYLLPKNIWPIHCSWLVLLELRSLHHSSYILHVHQRINHWGHLIKSSSSKHLLSPIENWFHLFKWIIKLISSSVLSDTLLIIVLWEWIVVWSLLNKLYCLASTVRAFWSSWSVIIWNSWLCFAIVALKFHDFCLY